MWADIKLHKSTMQICVNQNPPSDKEFKEFLKIWENLYQEINSTFVMAINFRDMDEISTFQAMDFIGLFFRVLPKTKEFLSCTIVCLNDKLKDASDIFLKLYNPSRPYYVFFDHDEFNESVKTHRRELKKNPTRIKCHSLLQRKP